MCEIELTGVTCGAAAAPTGPECSDTQDNAGDGVIDADDPGCHTDGDATNPDSYDATDDDETDVDVGAGESLPVTGASVPWSIVLSLGLGALAIEALRRRAT